MALRIITAAERLSASQSKASLCILGPAKVGKTSLVHTMPPETTLFVNLEAGMQSVQTWTGDALEPETWQEMCDVACLIAGPNPSVGPNDMLSLPHYENVKSVYRDLDLSRYTSVFVDSITDMTRLAMSWSKQRSLTDKGAPDSRGAYGLLGNEVISILKHMQRVKGKNMIFVGILDRMRDEFKRVEYTPQMEGGKAPRELPGIVDQVISYVLFDHTPASGETRENWDLNWDTGATRAFVCQKANPYGLPAGDRSGNLDMIEPPDLGKLIEKINLPARQTHAWLTKGK